jgi:hypothetical protein
VIRVSLTGIDGCGKTTVIRELTRLGDPRVAAFRAPQYHENPLVPHAALSADIDALSVLGDRLREPLLKASALLLSVTLYGDVERWYEREARPAALFGERQPFLDSLVYSLFYAKMLTGPISRERLEGAVIGAIGRLGLERVEAWSARLFGDTFWNVPVHARELFSREPRELLPRLAELYRLEMPDHLILLRVSGVALAERLALKRGAGGSVRELHEEQAVLERLQAATQACVAALRQAAPRMRVSEIETSGLGVEETRDVVVKAALG